MKETLSIVPRAALFQPQREAIESALRPYVEDLATMDARPNGAVVFVRDRLHTDSAGAVAHKYTPEVSLEQRAFTDANIVGHRIDTSAATLGHTLLTGISALSPSRMNPEHAVWGASITPYAAVQLAFDMSTDTSPPERLLENIWDFHSKQIRDAVEELIEASRDRTSLANDLLLDTPVTPNAYVIKWDVTGSTRKVSQNYPLFRNYLQELEQGINASIEQLGGSVVSYNGDGQNIVVDIPPEIDRNDLTAIGKFGQRSAEPLIRAVLDAHKQIAPNFAILDPNIRIALGLGPIENSEMGEKTGRTFWDVADVLESLPRQRTSSGTTDVARLALWLARQK